MCEERPCWGTPKDAAAIIEAGLGDRLMLDYWANSETDDTYILAPAIVGYERNRTPFWPRGRCTFLTKKGLCELHDAGLKPTEGRLAMCGRGKTPPNLHETVAKEWETPEAIALVASWDVVA
jgi:hypothetical protein